MKNLVALGILLTCVIFDNYLIQNKKQELEIFNRVGHVSCVEQSSSRSISSLSELERKMKNHDLLRKSCL